MSKHEMKYKEGDIVRIKPNKRQCNDDCAYMKQFIKLIKSK